MRKMVSTSVHSLNPEQHQEMAQAIAHEMTRRGAIASSGYLAAMAVAIFSSPYSADHPHIVYSATVIFTITFLIRIFTLWRFKSLYQHNPSLWFWLKAGSVFITALTWGCVSGLAIYYYKDTWTALLATIGTVSMCAGSIYSLGMHSSLVRTYLAASLLPNLVASIIIGLPGLAIFFGFYFIYCAVQSHYLNQSYREARINAHRLDTQAQHLLHKLTYHDPLTNLPNRALFNDRLEHAIRNSQRRYQLTSVLIIGLDRFSEINDTLGHHAGNKILTAVADRLTNSVRANDTVARYSNDTFAIALENIQHASDAARVANKIIENMHQPFEVAGLELFITTSIGISIYPLDTQDPENLINNAESTMRHIKESGCNKYQYY